MFLRRLLRRLPIDPYLIAIVSMAALASVLPCRGAVATGFDQATRIVIGLLFFLYGARLSPQAAWQGLSHWRLQGLILASTFVLFPALGLAAHVLVPRFLPAALYPGLLLLCMLPSTVQSSIAFTSIARGNVAAAVCAASASSLLGIVVTPLLVGLLMGAQGGISTHSVEEILLQLLAPFAAGQLVRPWIGGWLGRHKWLTGLVDRGSILLIVYTAFSEGVVNGIWHRVDLASLVSVMVVNILLLGLVLTATTLASRWLGFSREDEIAIVFCGSKKSLASGIPMINVLFPASVVGLMVLPLILFHQTQLMVCATLARRYARREGPLSEHSTTSIATKETMPSIEQSRRGQVLIKPREVV
ncbi:MAG TPA: bile acid:sodium symporter family protein [Acetobacteraceae bacterium]|nr:bile acid:sodium symporter family protein [Acetobacteraceae bacterium]